MSSNAEFLQNWNEIIQFPIKESDLLSPNEAFLTNALLHYLQEFNFNIKHIIIEKNSESQETRIKFKISLCRYINHLYKLGNEDSHSFLYYDLIKPTPRKTIHLLKFLLNYLFFYNMTEKEIIEEVDILIDQREKHFTKLGEISREIKQNECIAENISKDMEDFAVKLPQCEKKINKLVNRERELSQVKEQLLITLDNHETKISELKINMGKSRLLIVTDEEFQTLLNKRNKLKHEIDEQTEFWESIKTSHQTIRNTIKHLTQFLEHCKSTMSIICVKENDENRELKKKYQETKEKIQYEILEKENFIELIEKINKSEKYLRNELNKKNISILEFQTTFSSVNSEYIDQIDIEVKRFEKLDSKLHDVEEKMEKENQTYDDIFCAAKMITEYLTSREPNVFQYSQDIL